MGRTTCLTRPTCSHSLTELQSNSRLLLQRLTTDTSSTSIPSFHLNHQSHSVCIQMLKSTLGTLNARTSSRSLSSCSRRMLEPVAKAAKQLAQRLLTLQAESLTTLPSSQIKSTLRTSLQS